MRYHVGFLTRLITQLGSTQYSFHAIVRNGRGDAALDGPCVNLLLHIIQVAIDDGCAAGVKMVPSTLSF